MMPTPPIPSAAYKSAEQSATRRFLVQLMAVAACLLSLAACVLAVTSGGFSFVQGEASHVARPILAAAAAVLTVAGLFSGIIGLCAVSRYGKKALFVPALLGTIM